MFQGQTQVMSPKRSFQGQIIYIERSYKSAAGLIFEWNENESGCYVFSTTSVTNSMRENKNAQMGSPLRLFFFQKFISKNALYTFVLLFEAVE